MKNPKKRALRKIFASRKTVMGRGLERVKERKIDEILPKFPENLSQKGEPCESGISNPFRENV